MLSRRGYPIPLAIFPLLALLCARPAMAGDHEGGQGNLDRGGQGNQGNHYGNQNGQGSRTVGGENKGGPLTGQTAAGSAAPKDGMSYVKSEDSGPGGAIIAQEQACMNSPTGCSAAQIQTMKNEAQALQAKIAASGGSALSQGASCMGGLCTPAVPAGHSINVDMTPGQGVATNGAVPNAVFNITPTGGGGAANSGDPLPTGNSSNQVGPGPAPLTAPVLAHGSGLELGYNYTKDISGAPAIPVGKQPGPAAQTDPFTSALQGAATKLQMKDFERAAAEARNAIAAGPSRPEGHALLAKALQAQAGRNPALYSEVERAAADALRLMPPGQGSPQAREAWETLSHAQLMQGKGKAAFNSASEAHRIEPLSARALFLRALAREALGGQRDKMLEDLREAAKLDPKYDSLLKRVLAGGKLFDPNEQDNGGLLDSLPAARRGPNLFILAGLAVLLLALLAGGIHLSREKLADLRLSKAERLKREMAQAVAAGEDLPEMTPAPASASEDANGLLAGKYQMTRIIGKGGMGQVWEARDHSLDRPVAIKKMSEELLSLSTGKARELYVKEARTLASLRHPGIVAIYEILDHSSGLYLVFELVSGKTLQQVLAEKRSLPLALAKQLLRPVCSALQYAHEQGVAHRDLKPSNIMVTDQGSVKVMDFGLARRTGEAVVLPGAGTPIPRPGTPVPGSMNTAKTHTIAGTPAYMAPEQARGTVAAASDVYALGVILYELLTGERPFGVQPAWRGGERSYVKAGARVAGLPPQVDALIDAALEPKLEARLPSAKEFLARLEAVPEPAAIP